MEYIKATESDAEEIYTMVQDTIRTIYPRYYPQEVTAFFCGLHCKENIAKDIRDGFVGVLRNDTGIVGTGCYKDNQSSLGNSLKMQQKNRPYKRIQQVGEKNVHFKIVQGNFPEKRA